MNIRTAVVAFSVLFSTSQLDAAPVTTPRPHGSARPPRTAKRQDFLKLTEDQALDQIGKVTDELRTRAPCNLVLQDVKYDFTTTTDKTGDLGGDFLIFNAEAKQVVTNVQHQIDSFHVDKYSGEVDDTPPTEDMSKVVLSQIKHKNARNDLTHTTYVDGFSVKEDVKVARTVSVGASFIVHLVTLKPSYAQTTTYAGTVEWPVKRYRTCDDARKALAAQ